MKKIGISFKDTEMSLYEYVKSQLSPSIYIKQLIKNDMEKEDSSIKEGKNNLDFDF